MSDVCYRLLFTSFIFITANWMPCTGGCDQAVLRHYCVDYFFTCLFLSTFSHTPVFTDRDRRLHTSLAFYDCVDRFCDMMEETLSKIKVRWLRPHSTVYILEINAHCISMVYQLIWSVKTYELFRIDCTTKSVTFQSTIILTRYFRKMSRYTLLFKWSIIYSYIRSKHGEYKLNLSKVCCSTMSVPFTAL